MRSLSFGNKLLNFANGLGTTQTALTHRLLHLLLLLLHLCVPSSDLCKVQVLHLLLHSSHNVS